jgi:hypothetical protein
MQGIYSYTPEWNHASRVYSSAVIIYVTYNAISLAECSVLSH